MGSRYHEQSKNTIALPLVACRGQAADVRRGEGGDSESCEESAPLPRLSVPFAIAALLVSGCTTADIASDLGVNPQLALAATDTPDPDLPDAVDAVPEAGPAILSLAVIGAATGYLIQLMHRRIVFWRRR